MAVLSSSWELSPSAVAIRKGVQRWRVFTFLMTPGVPAVCHFLRIVKFRKLCYGEVDQKLQSPALRALEPQWLQNRVH